MYYYGFYQPLFDVMERELPSIRFHDGLPSEEELNELADESVWHLVVLDDLMGSVTASPDMKNLFVKGMHHRHLSLIYLNQNMFCKGKHSRTINLNSHMSVLMKNPTCLNSSV